MALWRRLESRLSWLPWYRRRARDADLERELRDHLELEADEQRAAGLSSDQAANAAHRALGNTLKIEEDVRAAWGLPWLEPLAQDVRYSLRMLRKSPGFTGVAILTLAFGIGANAAIFSIVDAVLLHSLPFKNADRLVDLTEYRPGAIDRAGASFPDYLAWKQQNTVFEETAAYYLTNASNDIVLGGPFSTERAHYSTVTNSFFTVLGVHPALGHGFSAGDESPGGPKVFLISDALWKSMFGGNPRSIGKAYLLDGEDFTLVGVMPPGFDFPKGCGIWVSTSTLGESGLQDRISYTYHVLGRLRSGANLVQAAAQIKVIQARVAKAYPTTDTGWHVNAQPLFDEVVGHVQTSLFVLLGAVGFIFLIACANVVNLMLARASVREKEFAIRAALGGSQIRLLRQNLTEAFVLVCASLALAVAFAKWGLALAVSLTAINLPRMEPFRLDVPVLAFISGVASLATLLVGVAPALQLSRQDPQGALREVQYAGESGRRARKLRSVLIVSEVSLALVLLCGAGLMLRSFAQLVRVDPGFRAEHLLTMKIALPSGEYQKVEQTSAYLDRLLERLRASPAVESAAAASTLPLSGESDWGTFLIAGRSAPDWTKASAASWRGVSADYFRTLGTPLLRGRDFTSADAQAGNALIINEAMAKIFWPQSDPIGRHILERDRRHALEIVGIVADAKGVGLDAKPQPEMYTLLRGFWYAFLAVRTGADASRMASMVRQEITALDPGVPVYQVATMDQLLSRSVAPQRFDLFLLALLAVFALALAAVGIYGVVAFSVSRRTHEIGIRLALGADRGAILRLIVREGMKFVLVGIVLGIVGAVVLTRLMSSLLYSVSATDPATFAAVASLLLLAALAACWIPARRAMRVDPMVALRYE